MSLEGGSFYCGTHKYETDDLKKWDKHCYETKHPLDVVQQCPNCGTENKETIPYPKDYVLKAHSPQGSGILLECKKCFGGTDREELV